MSKLVEKFRDVTARRPSGWLGRKMYHDPKGHYPSFRMVMERLQLRPEDKFLEVACGGGSLLEMALENVRRNLEAAGMAVSDIVRLTIYLVEGMDADRRREIFSKWLGEHAPTMTLMYVAALATPAIKLELEATACADA